MVLKKYFRFKFYREIFSLKYQLFRNENFLNIKNKILISKKKSKLSKKKIDQIFYLINEQDEINRDSMWFNILNNYHIKFLNIVKNDKKKLNYILNNPHNYNIFYGFDDNCKILHDNSGFNFNFRYSKLIIDKLISFCEYLGILRLDYPESIKQRYKFLDIEELIIKIEKKIKLRLYFNNPFPGEKGINTSRGILQVREIQAIYQALRIKQILKHENYKIKNVLEFGGGLGRTAYYCYKFGVKNYTLVDLLVPRICQINYLSRVVNENKIILNPKKFEFSKNNIKIISPKILFSNNFKFDLIFNSDSFTEIDYVNQKKYQKYILKNSKIFYSINHENNPFKVSDFFKKSNLLYYSKNLYWLRRGYIEEEFKFKD